MWSLTIDDSLFSPQSSTQCWEGHYFPLVSHSLALLYRFRTSLVFFVCFFFFGFKILFCMHKSTEVFEFHISCSVLNKKFFCRVPVSHLWVCAASPEALWDSADTFYTPLLDFQQADCNLLDKTWLTPRCRCLSTASLRLQSLCRLTWPRFATFCPYVTWFLFFPSSPPQITPRPLSNYSDIVLIQTHIFYICNATSVGLVTLCFFQLVRLWNGPDVTIFCWRRRGFARSNNATDDTSMVEHGDGMGPWGNHLVITTLKNIIWWYNII